MPYNGFLMIVIIEYGHTETDPGTSSGEQDPVLCPSTAPVTRPPTGGGATRVLPGFSPHGSGLTDCRARRFSSCG